MKTQKPDLRELRGDRSLESVAKELGVTRQAISLIERGQRGVGLRLALGFRRMYGIPVETWVDE